MLSVQYRNPINFSRDLIQQAAVALQRLRTALDRLKEAPIASEAEGSSTCSALTAFFWTEAVLPEWMVMVAIRLRTTRAIARPHVSFSRKSVVLRTPIIWLGAEKFAASPPPLEF